MSENSVQGQIAPLTEVRPKIYAYTTPEIERHNGWTKIGYTEAQTPEERIKQQTKTADVKAVLEWSEDARYIVPPPNWFKDHQFHKYLVDVEKVDRLQNDDKTLTEWFRVTPDAAHDKFNTFVKRGEVSEDGRKEYTLRDSQMDAVDRTIDYFDNGGTAFLWNAKPRFGKTLAVYDLIQKMGFWSVLIVTNRPSVAESWWKDFHDYVGWHDQYVFVSSNALLSAHPDVLSRDAYSGDTSLVDKKGMIAFESFQGLKRAKAFGGDYADEDQKYEWIKKHPAFDLVVIDESHEGTETERASDVLKNITAKRVLHLSGTPFKALATGKFSTDQIYNWTYADEQEARTSWSGESFNPYEELPQLSMFTYQMSDMAIDKARKGVDLDETHNVDYAFDLNEFFSTKEDGTFAHEDDVRRFLEALRTQHKYPFSTPELRNELRHTLWYLQRVKSAKALARLLQEDPVFKEYEIVIIAGDGKSDNDEDDALDEKRNSAALAKVRTAIDEAEKTGGKTITITVGQLTVGATVPEWSGILMLRNLKSPSSYVQAMFRVQNPYRKVLEDGTVLVKQSAYVFDFDPSRTLRIIDEYANRLATGRSSDEVPGDERKDNIGRLLNFFPVIGEDAEGRMVELNTEDVLAIPNRIVAHEVVRHGFMSNFLFQNVTNLFSAPPVVKEILGKLKRSDGIKLKPPQPVTEEANQVDVDENGNPAVPADKVIGKSGELFGDKVYEKLQEGAKETSDKIEKASENTSSVSPLMKALQNQAKEVAVSVNNEVTQKLIDDLGLKKSEAAKAKKLVQHNIAKAYDIVQKNLESGITKAEDELAKANASAESHEERMAAQQHYETAVAEAKRKAAEEAETVKTKIIDNAGDDVTHTVLDMQNKQKAAEAGKDIREHLRGFSRTIPSFLMAYGDKDFRLSNLDNYVNPNSFEDLTECAAQAPGFIHGV